MNRHPGRTLELLLLLWSLGQVVEGAQGGTFLLPLTQTNGWQFLSYRKIPPNHFHSTPLGLVIGVTNSAAPAVFPLTSGLRVVGLTVSGNFSGSLNLPPGKQGERGYDDYALRVGLVETGARTLSWWERKMAADWVETLFALAPRGTGIGKIRFFNVGMHGTQVGHSRSYSSSVPMEQIVVAVPDAKGHFAFTKLFVRPLNVVAVWISCDGDDTHSRFALTLQQLELATDKE